MAILFMDGCDLYGANADIVARFDDSDFSYDATNGRFGGGCIYRTNLFNGNVLKVLGSNHQELYGFFCANAYEGDWPDEYFLRFWDGGSEQINVYIAGSNEMILRRGSTVLETAASPSPVSQWNYYEWYLKVDNAAGAFTLKENGVTILDQSGIDTQQTANAYCNRVSWHASDNGSTYGIRFDDLIVWSVSGDAPTGWVGDMRVETVRPNADTAQEDFTPLGAGDQFAEIDDAPGHDSDTSYNASSTSLDKDRVELGAMAGEVDTIYAVNAVIVAKKSNAADCDAKVGVYSGATEDVSAAQPTTTDYDFYEHLLTDNPDDSLPWEEADVNALQLQYERA